MTRAERQAEARRLHDGGRGLNVREIAEQLGVSVGTAHRDINPDAEVRYRLAERFDLGKGLAAEHPDLWEVFCVTTNEGRCRVISRPRGGWS